MIFKGHFMDIDGYFMRIYRNDLMDFHGRVCDRRFL